MTNDRKDEAPAGSAEEWPKRAPPTIDLEASEVSGDTQAKGSMDAARGFAKGAADKMSGLAGILAWLVAPLSGALAALLVLAAFWAAGLIGQPHRHNPCRLRSRQPSSTLWPRMSAISPRDSRVSRQAPPGR